MQIDVNEIFVSIQGEGPHVGIPTVFVRTQGCNLNCEWCDTKKAIPNSRYNVCGTDVVVSRIGSCMRRAKLSVKQELNICFTGGEPMLQQEAILEAIGLLGSKLTYTVETNGTIIPHKQWLKVDDVTFVISPKDLVLPAIKYPPVSYYKFVFNDNIADILKYIKQNDIILDKTMLMPLTLYKNIDTVAMAQRCATACIQHGIKMCPRLQIMYGLR